MYIFQSDVDQIIRNGLNESDNKKMWQVERVERVIDLDLDLNQSSKSWGAVEIMGNEIDVFASYYAAKLCLGGFQARSRFGLNIIILLPSILCLPSTYTVSQLSC